MDKEIEYRLKELGIESPEDAAASREWRSEREELLERTAREQELLQKEMAESESRLGERASAHEVDKREWRLKYYLLIKCAPTRGAGTTTLNNMLTLDCGQPLEDFHLISNSYYRRDWEKCIIIVNPKTGSTGSISLGGSYTDIETGGSVSSIVLPAKSGAILIEQ